MTARPDAYLLRYGELALKKKNRHIFEHALIALIKPRIKGFGGSIEKRHKKMILRSKADPQEIRRALSTVFGLSSVSPIWNTTHQIQDIKRMADALIAPHRGSGLRFAVRAKRAFKAYPRGSVELQHEIADHLYDQGLDLPVDLKRPELTLGISIEFDHTIMHIDSWPGLGGLPPMPGNRFGLLLSGGIDSPVAGHMIQKRGGTLTGIYFHTPPYTVEAAKNKVIDLARLLSRYQNKLELMIVNFTDVMKMLVAECDQRFIVVLSRRAMMRVAQRLLLGFKGQALVTGESLSQVASQTIHNIAVINKAVDVPVLRPLIGFDKQEIVARARSLGSFDVSVQPYQDCCSLFAPANPATKASPYLVSAAEGRLPLQELVDTAVDRAEILELCHDD